MGSRRSAVNEWHVLALLGIGTLLAMGLWGDSRIPGRLLPHGYCFTWDPQLLTVHVASDLLIGAAYISIPLTLLHLVRRRGDLPFNWIFLLFALFIVSCGATHWMEVWTIWRPDYWLSGSVKAVTAVASVLTAVALVQLIPRILAIPTVAQLQQAKAALEQEVAQRRAAEEALQRERASLAQRVEERTRELASARAVAEAAHAQAQAANRTKDEFLARVSHELRTPLQATIGWAQVLGHTGLTPERLQTAVERIRHNVTLQARMLDDLLDVARILSGKLRFELHRIDPVEPLRRAVEVVQPRAAQRGIVIETELDMAGAQVLGDAARLEQVLWNLLTNAVNASPEDARVRLSAQAEGERLHIAVQDWGHGIAAQDLASIFEPFRQLRPDAARHGGLGLGLAIAHNIVALFGGELKAYSAGEGQGATFSVELPLQPAAAAAPSPDEERPLTEAERAALRGVRILYVEDAADIAQSVSLMLHELGAQVSTCTGYAEAAERIDQGGFDVLLCDLHLGPGPGGLELVRHLRARYPTLPALALSAFSTENVRSAALQAGFQQHLSKPASLQRIGRALVQVLSRRA